MRNGVLLLRLRHQPRQHPTASLRLWLVSIAASIRSFMRAVRLRAKSGTGLVMRRRCLCPRLQPSPLHQRHRLHPATVLQTGQRRFPRASALSMAGLSPRRLRP